MTETVDVESIAVVLTEWLGERRPSALLTLGTGLGGLVAAVEDPRAVAATDLGLPATGAPGHAGQLVSGRLGGVEVLVQAGRLHLYEGADPSLVTACVEAAALAGVRTYVVTNAAGGIAPHLAAGDLLCISDHLNLTGTNPLIGRARPQFVDLTRAYDRRLREIAHAAAERGGHRLVDGVYAGLVGPTLETPAEIRMLAVLGADAVGMSTVTEVIAARARQMAVLGLSLVTNVHRPGGTPTSEGEIREAGRACGQRIVEVVAAVLREHRADLQATSQPGEVRGSDG